MKLKPSDFLSKFRQLALMAQSEHKIPALIKLAQCACETGWGEAIPGNMCFGIKADASWKGEKRLVVTQEVINGKRITIQDYFRKYPDIEASWEDHSLFLLQNTRYARAFIPTDVQGFVSYLKDNDFEDQADLIQRNPKLAHAWRFALILHLEEYATAPDYHIVLWSIMLSFYEMDKTLA